MSQLKHRDEDRAVRPSKCFSLDRNGGKLMAVCSGIARYFCIGVTWVRIACVAGTLLGLGSFILIYLAIGLMAD